MVLYISWTLYNMHADRTKRHLTRGRYLPVRPYSLLMLSTSSAGEWDWRSQLLHEFCHRVEHVRPPIPRLERQYCKSRKEREKPFAITYADPRTLQCNKLYCIPKPLWEVLTTGYEAIMFGYESPDGSLWEEDSDPEHRDFVLGVVACC